MDGYSFILRKFRPPSFDKLELIMKILVVEDYADFRDALALLLQIEGFEVCCAVDGKEGLLLAQQQSPDLIVTDVEMPNLNGIEMIKLIRREAKIKTVPIIAVTAHNGRVPSEALEAGATCVLSKPLQFELLYDLTAELLNKPN